MCRRWRNQALAAAWLRWWERMRARRQCVRVASKVLARWRHQALTRVLERWMECARQRRRWRRTAASVLARWSRRCVVQALVTWQEGAWVGRRVRRCARAIVLRWQRVSLASAFGCWVVFGQDALLARGAEKDRLSRAEREGALERLAALQTKARCQMLSLSLGLDSAEQHVLSCVLKTRKVSLCFLLTVS